MHELILNDLMAALDIVVLERQPNGAFHILSPTPEWFCGIYPQAATGQTDFQPAHAFDFLDNFLIDAEAWWHDNQEGWLKSGPWQEADPSGCERYLQAIAIRAGSRKLLLLEQVTQAFEEKHAILQSAREVSLSKTKLEQSYEQVRKSHDDLISILNQLRLGTAITDEHGRVMFLSQTCRDVMGLCADEALGMPWQEAFPFEANERRQIHAMMQRPQQQRSKVLVTFSTNEGHQRWMEVEVQDDPRDRRRAIFFFYDVTELHDLRQLLDEKAVFHGLVGVSPAMQQVYQHIREVAEVDWTVLIEGETGTGKELVARAIHQISQRKDQPFIAVNCGGLTESILTSQLFGHRRGAFTGAVTDHKGFFEAANGGTIFLDEIGDMPLSVQTNLLRVLQEKEITRLGESMPRKVDVRVIVATHRNLAQEVEAGRFRADLLYRIRVGRIQLPPLRHRREDIRLLIESFLSRCRAVSGKAVTGVSQDAMLMLMEYEWPGNVRELKSAIEYAVIRCRGSIIQAEDLPAEIRSARPPEELPQDEKQRLLAALKRAGGNRTTAARMLGIGRSTFYRKLASLDIKPEASSQ
ncbi:MAG: sigma 54-interacting transcriptional regulator [Acidobacteriota bacterium]|nr:sigma-54-dependent Fis family transcriptional regulator [Blastocatellia bacterium]MDW8239174.1 sigma 54-interacting transcriptional regulator [Acidobacteriota bacterium]